MHWRQRSQLQLARDSLVLFPILLGVVHGHFTSRGKFQELVERYAAEFGCFASGDTPFAEQFECDELGSGTRGVPLTFANANSSSGNSTWTMLML